MQQTGTAGSYDLSSDYRYGYNGKEKDDEIKGEANSLDFGARIYDPRVGRWMSTDPLERKYAAVSSYVFSLDNPVKYVDPDGTWIPSADQDNNILVTKEEGDTKESLAKFMGDGWSEKAINKMWKALDKNTESINLTKTVGGVFKSMTKSMNAAEKAMIPTMDEYLAHPADIMGDNYNCWGTCIALNDGKKLQGKGKFSRSGVGIEDGCAFDEILQKQYSSVSREEATVGKTILRYADKNTNSIENGHGSIFMGVDNSGVEYSFSKNGWFPAPGLFLKSQIDLWYTTIGGNNEVRGINSDESGYYQKSKKK